MKRFRNLSIQNQISGLFLVCFLILLVGIIFVLHDVYKKQMYHELVQGRHYEDELILHQIEQLEQNVESCCNNMIINLNLAIGSKEGIIGSPDKYDQKIREKILGVIDNNFLLFPDISAMAVVYENGDMYFKERYGNFIYTQYNDELVDKIKETDADTLGIWYYYPKSGPGVYFLKVFRNITENSQIGYVILELKEDVIYKTYGNQTTDNPSDIYIFDNNDIFISSTRKELVERAYGNNAPRERMRLSEEILLEIDQQLQNGYYVKRYQTKQGWLMISVLDIEAGMQGLRIITWNIVGIGITLALVSFFIMHRILRRIMHPVVALANHMREKGMHRILEIQEYSARGEVGILISSFNQMVDTNEKLIQRIARDEKEKRHLELALLQMQIKPHFLYNTLDTAFCLNRMKQHQKADAVIKQLARYYRLVLNHGDEWISFSEELEAVENYLAIQSVRYSELMSYAICVDEMCGFKIPKMTLQPLVENAIYYGIKPSGRKGHILISAEICKDEVAISITDDGVGMTQEMFEEILSGKRKSTDQESFGMKSVMERLQLFYGDETRMELSKMPMGTSIVLNIHLKEESSEISSAAGGR